MILTVQEVETTPVEDSIVVNRQMREIRMPTCYTYMVTYALLVADDDIPVNFKEATKGSESADWHVAMEDEMQFLQKNQTWDLVKLRKENKVIGCKWVYTKKEDSHSKGSLCYNAWLVAKGYA